MSEKYKFVTIKGQEYRVGKFSARDGAFILVKVSGILGPVFAPLLKNIDVKTVDNMKPSDIDLGAMDIGAMFAPLSQIDEKDFMYLQTKCMSVCQVKMPSGYVPAMHDNGSFSTEALEEDSMTVMALMVHTIMHNFMGFFGGSPSNLLAGLGGILGSSSQN